MKFLFFITYFILNLNVVFSQIINLEEDSTTNSEMNMVDDLKSIQKSFSDSLPSDNTRRYQYNINHTYKIRLRTTMNTLIVLPESEEIRSYNLGSNQYIKAEIIRKKGKKTSNQIVIKNTLSGIDTNLFVIGKSGNIYSFYLRVDNEKSNYLPDLLVFIEDSKLSKSMKSDLKNKNLVSSLIPSFKEKLDKKQIGDYLKKIDMLPKEEWKHQQDLNFRYSISENKHMIPPIKVFDNGYWTFFKISDFDNLNKVSEFPEPFVVDEVEKINLPTNSQIIGEFIVVKTIANHWILVNGKKYICIDKITDNSDW